MLLAAALAGVLAVAPAAAGTAGPSPADRPDAATCVALHPARFGSATGSSDPRGDLRVVGVQYRQDISAVVSYDTFRTRMRCLVEELVVPHEVPGRPTLAVFNEDIGLMTLATGARGATVRAQADTRAGAPAGDAEPVGVASALGELNAAYAPQIAAVTALVGPVDPRKQIFLGATDTEVRAFNITFSDIARDYGIYVVASNNEPTYRETHDPTEVAELGDPELEPGLTTAYVPTTTHVPNATFLWGPSDIDAAAPDGARNLLFRNEKVPLTSLESTILALDPGASTGAAGRPNAAGAVVAGHRLGFATSLPAFVYGYGLGQPRPAGDPCADTSVSYVPCMDSLGVDTVVQAEANPGRWAGPGGNSDWQPLEWMASAWRAVSDPTVHFRYAINPMMVGNLLDLPFDGQSAILARGGGAAGRYVGDAVALPSDAAPYQQYAGDRPGFLALAPWVVPDASRAALQAEGARLAPGSGDAEEDDYLETAVYADLAPVAAPVAAAAPVTLAAPPAGSPGRHLRAPARRPVHHPARAAAPTPSPPQGTLAVTGGTPGASALLLLVLPLVVLHVRRTRRSRS